VFVLVNSGQTIYERRSRWSNLVKPFANGVRFGQTWSNQLRTAFVLVKLRQQLHFDYAGRIISHCVGISDRTCRISASTVTIHI
jgi:hypothetical protein